MKTSLLPTLELDGTKLAWHCERVERWQRWLLAVKAGRGPDPADRIAPITIDMALTRRCNARCIYCYGALQENERRTITSEVMTRFLDNCADIGVKAVSLVSDGESTLSPAFEHTIIYGKSLGLDMACGTNGLLLGPDRAERVLPSLSYLRVNISGATPQSYEQIMGVNRFDQAVENIRAMIAIKARLGLKTTLGMQMVLMPQFQAEILPLARLAVDLGVDYLVIKHCSDDEMGSLGVRYGDYAALIPLLQQAEAISTSQTKIQAKWSKLLQGGRRDYSHCYGPAFIIQLSGSGLVAPCGMLFNSRYSRYHIGNIVEQSFADLWRGERYWEVMEELALRFNPRTQCGSLCLQDLPNRWLNRGEFSWRDDPVEHRNFV